MIRQERGALPADRAPGVQLELGLSSNINSSAKKPTCKPIDQTIFGRFDRQGIEAQLQAYLDLGLTPIPLKGKIPIVKWLHGDWHPQTLNDLRRYMPRSNWGLKTGGNFAVIDFDNNDSFAKFIAQNIDRLPDGIPIVKTGRGYHLWLDLRSP